MKFYGRSWIVAIEDVSDLVAAQREFQRADAHDRLVTPVETVYPVADPAVAARLGVTAVR